MTFNESTSIQIDTRELTNHINRTKRVLIMAYESMVPQRYKQEAKEIQMRLDKLESECKYNDLSRAKSEAGLWKKFITKIISQTNRGIWMSGTDGKKYKSVVDTFEKLVDQILGELTVNPTEIEKEVYYFELIDLAFEGSMPILGGSKNSKESHAWVATCKVNNVKDFKRLKDNNFNNVELALSSKNKTLYGTKLVINDELLKKQILLSSFGGQIFEGNTKDGKSPSFNNPLIVTKVSSWQNRID
jgi:hypothetical protein